MKYLLAPLAPIIKQAEENGDFRLAGSLIDRFLSKELPAGMAERLKFEKERLERLRKAYPYDRKAAPKILKERLKGFRKSELDGWIKAGFAAPRLIDGREKFTLSFASNIIFCSPALKKRIKQRNKRQEAAVKKMMKRVDELAKGAKPARYSVRAKITLALKSAPKEKVRCWLPFPRVGDQVSSARLIEASHRNYRLDKPGAEQRTIYFEGRDKKFFAEFEYDISESVPPKAGKNSNFIPAALRKYLKEEPPHIVFTPYIRNLAAAIIGKEKNRYKMARKIYDWLTANLTYNFVVPYGIFENISEHILTGLRGDCGFQAIAFITLCRAAGVPAKWQSGWFIGEGLASPHDWAMFYCGGWRFADVSFGTGNKKKEARRKFYFGNLDAFRMPANSEFGAPIKPEKKFYRSDPTDNQMGEVETKSANLYYDKFKYRIKLISFKKIS
ncbi:MAG: transglutaminase [Elusimicrobia bacterium CG08_land_8_20_14_0_20_51_18]|nr:MAG: transglutaminase [Elusimicrobia bacterium CG08_land_8_20_14_0_20_51_18]